MLEIIRTEFGMKELEGQRRWEKYPRKYRKVSFEVVWAWIANRRRICWQESDGDGGSGEKKERKTKAEVVG